MLSAFAHPASAHVKWFCSVADVTRPPIALASVLTPTFGLVCLGFLGLIFAGFLLDGLAARRWPRLASSALHHEATEERLIRLATGAFFLLLWDKGAFVLWERGDAILTPELMTAAPWIGAVQLGVAVSLAWRPTCLIGALGILVLYGQGVAQFGVFHMTDYLFFPGLAAYLALSAIGTDVTGRLRAPIVTASLAFSLMWTAVEKFLYPDWTYAVVAQHPDLAFGFPPAFVVVVAGFVEFTLAFYIVTGRGLVRIGAAAFAAIFVAAIPEFGHLDTVGHLPIVAILAAVCLRGALPIQGSLGLREPTIIAGATSAAALYVLSLVTFVAAYYGLQALQHR